VEGEASEDEHATGDQGHVAGHLAGRMVVRWRGATMLSSCAAPQICVRAMYW